MQDQDRNRSAARAFRAAAVLTAVSLLPGAGFAQLGDAEARAEITFAKGLAADWGFVVLAEDVIANLEQEGTSRKVGEELQLLKCEIYFIAGQNNSGSRDEFFKKSLLAYETFLEENEYSDHLAQAQAQLVSVAALYSKSLALNLESEAGEAAEALREEMSTVLTTAINMTGQLIEALKSIGEEDLVETEKRQLYKLIMDRGDLLLELAKIQEDGTFSFDQSFRAYESLVELTSEESVPGLRALVGIGDNLSVQGEWDEASSYYEYVVNWAIPIDSEEWKTYKELNDWGPAEIGRQFLFVQLATVGLVRSLSQAGHPDRAALWGLHFYNTWKREGLNLAVPTGHLSLLAVARALMDAGGYVGGSLSEGDAVWFEDRAEMVKKFPSRRAQRPALDLALTMAQSVNNENRGNTLQLRAQKVISEIISRPGVQVDPEILFEAAQGEFFDKDYPRAITSFKRVLSALGSQDEARRRELGPKTLWHIGRSFQYLDRSVEAAVTFQEATGDRWRGDPEYDALNAARYYDTMKALARGNSDALLKRMFQESEERAAEMTSDKGADITYNQADKLYSKKDFEGALAKYRSVEASAENYERALVFVGVCEYQLGKFDAAQSVFDAYLNTFLNDPINTTNDKRRVQRRKEASATAYYYWGICAYRVADAAAPGEGDWQKAVDKLADFHLRFPAQTKFGPPALYRTLIAYTRMDNTAEARKVYETMLEAFPTDRWTGKGSADYYAILNAQREASDDPERKTAILREMAEALQVLNTNGADPKFQNLRNESKHWIELEEWELAEALLERMLAKFEDTEEEALIKFVKPDLGRVFLAQHKVVDAANVLKPLVDDQLASRDTARNYALAITGWLEYTTPENAAPVITQVPGVGGEAFQAAAKLLQTLVEGSESWESEWYGYKLDLIYAYQQWGQVDGKKLSSAKKQIGNLSTNLGAQFKHEKIPEPMRQKFLWLANDLK